MTKSAQQRTVLFVELTGRGGGSNVSLRELLSSLDRNLYRPVLFFGDRDNAERWPGEEIHEFIYAGFDNYDFFPASWNARWLYHLARFALRAPIDLARASMLLWRIHPSVVHVNVGQAITWGIAARLAGYPVVWHVRELVSPNIFGRIQDLVYTWCSRKIIVASRAVMSRLPASGAKTVIVPNSVSIVSVADESLRTFRADARLRAGDFVVLLLGHQLLVSKGYLFLAEVAERLAGFADIKFLLAGHHEDPRAPRYHRAFRSVYRWRQGGKGEKEMIKARWHHLTVAGRAYFTGHIDARLAIAASTIVVSPNQTSEPFGRTVIEAYAQGKPVLAMNISALDELVIDGVTGWLLPPRPDRWAELITELYHNPRKIQNAGLAAKARSLEYSSELIAQRVMGVYEETLR